jgi:hypothetical protein
MQVFSNGSIKGAQLDVLKNLLRENDIHFLEKISLRFYKQPLNPHLAQRLRPGAAGASTEQYCRRMIVPIAGEVTVSENKVKAISHFPR